jgi:Tol biopolymer transport system component
MALTSGTKLGPYEIRSPLGAGGMGEVYRALDMRLGRDVAIKVLPSHLSSDPNLKMRLEREARAISSLNHPNICTLHDVGSQDGIDFLVMEYLEGETLQRRLLRGAMPLKQVLEYGIQIAEALDRAHQTGIAHRDLKPGNIMLTKSGAKLLDFGLAKPVLALVTGVSATGSLTPSTPTLSVASMTSQPDPLTQQGTVVGTFQYLAPEVIQGKEADARSDIFALGALLFEMISGKPAFSGKSQLSVMTAILENEPERIRGLSSPLEHVVHTCLAKDPAERWQSAREVTRELRWAAQIGMEPAASGASATPRLRLFGFGAAAGLAIAALIIFGVRYTAKPVTGPRLLVSVIPPRGVFPDTWGRNGPPQISPDGQNVAFVGCKSETASKSIAGNRDCSIWLQSLHSTEAREITGTSGGYGPFWSPDGRQIGFFVDGKLKRVGTDGGPIQIVCNAADGRGGSWGSKGTIVFAATRGSPIFRVPAEGGTPVAITSSRPALNLADLGSHRWPYFLPDGEHFLYLNAPAGACSEGDEIHFASLDSKRDVSLMQVCTSVAFVDGRLIYWRDGNLVAQAFDPGRVIVSGAPSAIVEHAAFDSSFGFGPFSASRDGKLLYVAGQGPVGAQLVWYDRAGKMLGTLGDATAYSSVAISPDGSRVVADTQQQRILLLDSRGTRTLVTLSSHFGPFPTWSADGRYVYFTEEANGAYGISAIATDGSASQQTLVTFSKGQPGAAFLAASPDGKYLAYAALDSAGKLSLYTFELAEGGKPRPFLSPTADGSAPAFSPDGKWLAYESTQSGKNEVYITPFPGGGAQYQVSTNGGERPVWRHDGKEMFYRENLRLMSVRVNTDARTVELGTPTPLFEVAARNLNGRWYAVSPDGRFLMNTTPASAQTERFELVVNWPAELNN